MKTLTALFFVFALAVSSTQAQQQETIKGNGQIVTQKRTLGSFGKLNVRVGMRVKITAGDAASAELEGESNILEHVLTDVKNGELTVTFAPNKSFNQTKGVVVTIHVPKLDQVMVSTGCSVDSDLPIQASTLTATVETGSSLTAPINAKTLKLAVKQGSKANLTGTVADADIELEGAGKLNAEKLTIARADVRLEGASRADIHVTETLSAAADGVSTINYTGNPTVKSEQATGLSKIRKQGK
ncbi:head GIN domain-containing protein [Spirosoma montaniterrae]|uniref:Putative auto-transporter adhesin head GIN domain-containing protein n=1 Tax=Spirosoma montaniterrae TaxID=1178516 RepID=A0A1P9WRT1_9BACT|nr:head GIN domain-containing protein [Spirosoma montaniterrae]AQG78074.1 hypothetical protein AWR27_01125 [Spirosoma montaniterrae]